MSTHRMGSGDGGVHDPHSTVSRSETDVVFERIAAQVVDFGFVFVLAFVFILVFFRPTSGLVSGTGIFLGAFVNFGYNFGLEATWNGRTVGKWLLGIRAVDESGRSMSAAQALLRSIPALFSFGWLSYLVALATMASTDRRQRLFDTVAGTTVVSDASRRNRPRAAG
ncbi:RDD family protein [Halovivax cerinus]|uniref:RDD family protein n=1 Tax=Halovivax cerinus TaxID=1487865 RepID=A0ABD5NQ85_9EURY|nr:RDD family protein [Halovivax cerinus]